MAIIGEMIMDVLQVTKRPVVLGQGWGNPRGWAT
jgi:hypothetical protein